MPKKKNAATGTFSDAERAAMKERAMELRTEARAKKDRKAGEKALLTKIAEMKGLDHKIGKKIHEIISKEIPSLTPKTWYGMPAYANKAGKVVCYFTSAGKFKSRYATFGFNDDARLDEGDMWPTSFAVTKLTPAVEKKITSLVKKAVG